MEVRTDLGWDLREGLSLDWLLLWLLSVFQWTYIVERGEGEREREHKNHVVFLT